MHPADHHRVDGPRTTEEGKTMERIELTASTEADLTHKEFEAREHGWLTLARQPRHVAGPHEGMFVTVAIK